MSAKRFDVTLKETFCENVRAKNDSVEYQLISCHQYRKYEKIKNKNYRFKRFHNHYDSNGEHGRAFRVCFTIIRSNFLVTGLQGCYLLFLIPYFYRFVGGCVRPQTLFRTLNIQPVLFRLAVISPCAISHSENV